MEEKNRGRKGEERSEKLQGIWKKWFRRDNLIVLVLTGILLFIIALPTKENHETESGAEEILGVNGGNAFSMESLTDMENMTEETPKNSVESEVSSYAAEQEEKLEKLLSSVEGVGKVEVMLTFVSSEELVVEKDAPVVRSNTVEKDSENGTRTITQYEHGDSTVFRSSSGESEPYVIKTLNPRVEGVLVVAEGAGDGTVNRNITEIAQALFGVEAHRVKVVSMKH